MTERTALQLALLPARRRPGPALRLPRPRARTSPSEGHRFNPAKLLIDPYAKAIEGAIDWDAANVLPYVPDPTTRTPTSSPTTRTTPTRSPSRSSSTRTSTGRATGRRSARGTRRSSTRRTSRASRSCTPACARTCAGTYAGLASDEAIAYLKDLGVTAVELLPIHHIADESFLHEKGLTNYWGYSSIGYLAPHARTRRPARTASRSASSRGWSRRCTAPASR